MAKLTLQQTLDKSLKTAKQYIDTELAKKADSSHGTHVSYGGNGSATTVSRSDHTHNYAGSSSAGGAATSANKLNTNAGGTMQPVYFTNGVPTALKAFKNNTTKGALGHVGMNEDIMAITSNTLAYWDGAYSGTSSNLTYCNRGAFGTIITKNTGDYLPISGGTLTGMISVPGESRFYSGTYADPWTGTNCAIKATGHIATTGTVKSETINISNKVQLKYNSTSESLDFIFI